MRTRLRINKWSWLVLLVLGERPGLHAVIGGAIVLGAQCLEGAVDVVEEAALEPRQLERVRGGAVDGVTGSILEPDDVVLTEVSAALHLDEGERVRPRVKHAVGDTAGDVDRLACDERSIMPIAGDDGST